MDVGTKLDKAGVMRILPHRDPFLFLDEVETILPGPNEAAGGQEVFVGRKIIGWMNVSAKWDVFRGHFPERPIMPGVLLVEAMAQAAAILAYSPNYHGKKLEVLLVGTDTARFRKPVLPGDRVRLEVVLEKLRHKFFTFNCTSFVDNQRVAEAVLTACFPPWTAT